MKKWTTGQVAKMRNISVRTLRYYDQINLLNPSYKDEHGKRYYSEDDLFQLEKIMILKSLSLPLNDIQEVLKKLTYKQILVSHYNYLQEEMTKLEASVAHTATLINMIDLEKDLSWERVSELVEIKEKKQKHWLDYFAEEDQLLLQESVPNLSNNDKLIQRYIAVLRDVQQCIDQDIKPESEKGLAIARKLIQLTDETFQGDTALMEKFWNVRKQPVENTGLYPISAEVLEFAEQCIAYAELTSKIDETSQQLPHKN